MESMNSSSGEPQTRIKEANDLEQKLTDQWLNERFESLLPKIQEEWPDLARQTLEATRGSLDELITVIAKHSGNTNYGVQEQLEELFNTASEKTKDFAESLEPLEKQLEALLDELNKTLRPKIEQPVRKRPLLALGIAAGIGVILGVMLSGGKR